MQIGSLTVVAAAALDLATVHLTAKGRQETAPVLPATLDGFCRHEHIMESHGHERTTFCWLQCLGQTTTDLKGASTYQPFQAKNLYNFARYY